MVFTLNRNLGVDVGLVSCYRKIAKVGGRGNLDTSETFSPTGGTGIAQRLAPVGSHAATRGIGEFQSESGQSGSPGAKGGKGMTSVAAGAAK